MRYVRKESPKIMKNFFRVNLCLSKLKTFHPISMECQRNGEKATFSIYDQKSITLSRHVQWWNIEEIITLSRMKYKWTNFMWNQNIFLLPPGRRSKEFFKNKIFMSWFSIRNFLNFLFFSCRSATAIRCPMKRERNCVCFRRKENEKRWDEARWSRFKWISSAKE